MKKNSIIRQIVRIGCLLSFVVFSRLWGNENSVCLFSLDYVYPQRHFYHVESASKELWSELDLLISDTDARIQLVEQSNHVYDQCKKVHKVVRAFVAHEKESNMYLADDVEYLLGILDCIEEKFLHVAQLVGTKRQGMMVSIYTLLLESKAFLDELLMHNQEVSMI